VEKNDYLKSIKKYKMSCVKAVCLRFTGDVAEFTIESNTIEETLSTKLLPKSVKRTQGNGSLSCRCEYPMDDMTVSVYAWNDGEAGDENKHDLPPPIDNDLYFGNVYLLGHIGNKMVDLTKSDYDSLINKYFEGFDDIGSEDSWSEEETVASDDSIHDFIVDG